MTESNLEKLLKTVTLQRWTQGDWDLFGGIFLMAVIFIVFAYAYLLGKEN